MDAEILDELYDPAELVHGQPINVPWKIKEEKFNTGMCSL